MKKSICRKSVKIANRITEKVDKKLLSDIVAGIFYSFEKFFFLVWIILLSQLSSKSFS
jgi:hypothetical protein